MRRGKYYDNFCTLRKTTIKTFTFSNFSLWCFTLTFPLPQVWNCEDVRMLRIFFAQLVVHCKKYITVHAWHFLFSFFTVCLSTVCYCEDVESFLCLTFQKYTLLAVHACNILGFHEDVGIDGKKWFGMMKQASGRLVTNLKKLKCHFLWYFQTHILFVGIFQTNILSLVINW